MCSVCCTTPWICPATSSPAIEYDRQADSLSCTVGRWDTINGEPAFLTGWRGEVRERAVTASREPGAGKRDAQMELTGWFPSRATPSPANRFFTRHETRNTAFPHAALEPQPRRPPGFWVTRHETRNTKHESRPVTKLPESYRRAVSRGFGVTNHETRDTNHGFFNTRHESRPFIETRLFPPPSPAPQAFPGRATPSRGQQVFPNHETRDTKHGF